MFLDIRQYKDFKMFIDSFQHMTLLSKLKQVFYGEKGIEFLAAFSDQLEIISHDGLADKIRTYNYARQMERLVEHSGQRVYVYRFMAPGLYAIETGQLVEVRPFHYVLVQHDDDDFGKQGIPFISKNAIKEIANENEEVLYFNPYIGLDWVEKCEQMTRDERIQFRRKVFGKAGLLKPTEVERKSL
jgi:hypothetical protein